MSGDLVEDIAKVIDPEAFGLPIVDYDSNYLTDRDEARAKARHVIGRLAYTAPAGWRLHRVYNQAPACDPKGNWIAELQYGTKNVYVRSTDGVVGYDSPEGAVRAAVARVPPIYLLGGST